MKNFLPTTYYILPTRRDGQSLIEILVALAVGTILIIAAISVIAPALRANSQADKVQVASALGKELLENVRVFSEANWYNISSLATSSANKYFLVSASSPFIAATGTEGILADGIASGTVGYWKLDESAGTTAYDFSGNNSTGTWNGTGNHSASGMVGGAGQFNGTNDYIQTPSSSTFSFGTGDFSFSIWIKPNSFSGYNHMFAYDGTQSNGALKVNITDGIIYYYSLSFSTYGTITQSLQLSAWNHVVFVRRANVAELYWNGALVGTKSGFNDNFAGTHFMRFGNGWTGEYTNGLMDDIRFYNRALSATEVKTINNAAIYTRYFYLDAVGRDVSDALLSSGGTNDPSTKKLSVVYGWLNGPTSTFSMYLTRFRNNVFDQTDWSGGSGQEGPATTTNSSFSTSTKIYHSTTTGSIIINFQ